MLHIGQQIKAFYIITINNNPGKSMLNYKSIKNSMG
jgi:hypothetical protein